jgi:hypothetical protein
LVLRTPVGVTKTVEDELDGKEKTGYGSRKQESPEHGAQMAVGAVEFERRLGNCAHYPKHEQ